MQAALKVAQSTVSKHLKILEEAGIVGFKKNGQWIDYFLIKDSSDPYVHSVLNLLEKWLEDDEEITFIAGAVSVFVSQASVLKYFGPQANKFLSYCIASFYGIIGKVPTKEKVLNWIKKR